jgi:hypothetical protein
VKIELKKDIKLSKIEFVGELDFFDKKSPYVNLFKGISTQDELIDILEDKDMPKSAIKNIIQRLEDLKVLKDGHLENIEDGFPQKEYGKYTLEIFENDTNLPFKFKNKDIKREKVVSRNISDNIEKNKKFIEMVQDKDNKDFRINKIENDKAYLSDMGEEELKIIFGDNKWKYNVNNKDYKTDDVPYDDLFKDKWSIEHSALKINFELIKDDDNFLKSFSRNYKETININNYGKLKGEFTDIPVIPESKNDSKEWLIYLLKNEIEKLNRYISKEELHQLWENTKEKYPKLKIFDIEFNFDTILNEFGRESKYYWLLQASIDLYPFNIKMIAKKEVVIQEQKNIDLDSDFFDKFNMPCPLELIIVDRWIVNLAQYQGLDKIIDTFNNPKVTIFTQNVQDKKNNTLINKIIKKHNIKIIEKTKKEIVHQRYWIFDNNYIYQTTESLDFITIKDNIIDIKYITFKQFEEKDLDTKLLELVNMEIVK